MTEIRTLRLDSPQLEGSIIEVWDTGEIMDWFVELVEPDRDSTYQVSYHLADLPHASPKTWLTTIRPATDAEIAKDQAERDALLAEVEAHRLPWWKRWFS